MKTTQNNVKIKKEEENKKLIAPLLAPLVGLILLLESGKETSNGWITTHPIIAASGLVIIVGSIVSMVYYSRRDYR